MENEIIEEEEYTEEEIFEEGKFYKICKAFQSGHPDLSKDETQCGWFAKEFKKTFKKDIPLNLLVYKTIEQYLKNDIFLLKSVFKYNEKLYEIIIQHGVFETGVKCFSTEIKSIDENNNFIEENTKQFEKEEKEKEKETLEEKFIHSSEKIKKSSVKPNQEQLLKLYGLYKQATIGDCNISKPGFFSFEANYKYEAWNSLKGYSKEKSMEEYVSFVNELTQ
jgi:diazepam-binding inhibitor (GABA receptor modulator, acyl-CoA-binding protein)